MAAEGHPAFFGLIYKKYLERRLLRLERLKKSKWEEDRTKKIRWKIREFAPDKPFKCTFLYRRKHIPWFLKMIRGTKGRSDVTGKETKKWRIINSFFTGGNPIKGAIEAESSGSGFYPFRQWLSRLRQKISLHLHQSSKIKTKVGKQQKSSFFLQKLSKERTFICTNSTVYLQYFWLVFSFFESLH